MGGDAAADALFAPRRHKDLRRRPKTSASRRSRKLVRGKTETIEATLNLCGRSIAGATRGGSDDAIDSNTPPVACSAGADDRCGRERPGRVATDDGSERRTSLPAASVPPALCRSGFSSGARGRRSGWRAAGGSGANRVRRGCGHSQLRVVHTAGWPGELRSRARDRPTASKQLCELRRAGRLRASSDHRRRLGRIGGNFWYHCCWTNVEVKVHVTKAAPDSIDEGMGDSYEE